MQLIEEVIEYLRTPEFACLIFSTLLMMVFVFYFLAKFGTGPSGKNPYRKYFPFKID